MTKIQTQIERPLPQNVEAEQALLGCLIVDSESSLEMLDTLDPSDFYDPRHKLIFEIVATMYYEGDTKVDFLTVSDRLEKKGVIDKAGGFGYLSSLITAAPSLSSAKAYARLVKEKSQFRKVIGESTSIIRSAYDEKLELDILGRLENLMNGVSDGGKVKRVTVEEVMQDLEKEIADYEEGRTKVISTGFEKLDKIVEGFIVPQIWIIGGFTGVGKTFFTLEIMKNLMRGGLRPVMFSAENSATRNLVRLLGCMTGFHEMKLFKGRWTPTEKKRIEQAKKELKSFPLIIYDDVFTTQELRLKAKKHKMKDGSNLIVVDYIQQFNPGDDVYKQMRDVSLDLQRIANELQMGVIAVSQISNEQASKREQVNLNFKGAGEIRAVSDVSIGLNNIKNQKHKLQAKVVKVRHGVPGEVTFDFFGEEQKQKGVYLSESNE